MYNKDLQYYRFCAYGFLKNLRFFEPFLIIILNSEGLSFTKIAGLYAIREIARNVMEIPAGVFADTLGRKKSMVFAFSTYIASFLLFYFSTTYLLFSLAFLLFALGDAFRTGTHKAMIFTYLKAKSWEDYKVDYYGHTRSWSQSGSALSAIGAGLLVFITKDFRLIFLLTIIPYLLDLVNLASYPGFLDQKSGDDKQGKLGLAFKSTISDFLQSFKSREVRRTVVSLSSYSGYYKAIKDFIQPIIAALALSMPFLLDSTDEEKTSIFIGVIYFMIFILSSIAARKSGAFRTKFSSARKALSSSVLLGAFSGLFSGIFVHLGLNLLAVVFFTGIYIVENLRKPIGVASIADKLNSHVLASALSAESQAETLFAAFFVLILGIAVDIAGLGVGVTLISGATLLISLTGKISLAKAT